MGVNQQSVYSFIELNYNRYRKEGKDGFNQDRQAHLRMPKKTGYVAKGFGKEAEHYRQSCQ